MLSRASASLAPKVFKAATAGRVAPAASTAVGNRSFLNFFSSSIKADFPEDISEEQVRKLFYLWNDALATLDPKQVADRYSSDPILLPTVSDEPRTDYAGLEDYFTNFLQLKPQGEIIDGKIKIGPGWCKDAGIYEFTMGASGDKVKARYSYVYVYEDGEWKIAHHHSSVMPEA
jgi:uncharacterized protein (TIGR02246 family)